MRNLSGIGCDALGNTRGTIGGCGSNGGLYNLCFLPGASRARGRLLISADGVVRSWPVEAEGMGSVLPLAPESRFGTERP